jgi:hypothetical protein
VRKSRGFMASVIRTNIRDRETRRRTSLTSSTREARIPEWIRAFLFFCLVFSGGHRTATLRKRRCSLTTCCEAAPVLAVRKPCINSGWRSTGGARLVPRVRFPSSAPLSGVPLHHLP